MKKLLFGMLVVGSMSASAIDIVINQTSCTLGSSALCDAMDAAFKEAAGADLPDVDLSTYATGIANSTAFAQKGLGSDYSDLFEIVSIKAGLGVGAQGTTDDPEGIGIGAAVGIGVNLEVLPVKKIGPVDLEKMDLFVSFMSYNIDQTQDAATFEGDLTTFSVMGRYQIVEGSDLVPGYMAEWGGVFLHTGFQKSSMELKLTNSFDDLTVESNGVSGTFSNSSALFSIDSSVLAIPVEVSTYMRFLYVFTLYTGAGLDFVSGSSDIDASAGGNMTATDYAATISLNAAEASGDADATNFRVFAGLQFNIPFVRLFAQVNKGLGNDLLGATFGLKLLY